MFRKVLFSSAMLLLASVNAVSLNCGDKSPADCRREFGSKVDKEVVRLFRDMMKPQLAKMTEIFGAVKSELPAGGVHANMLEKAMDYMNGQTVMLDKIDVMDVDDVQDTMAHVLISMVPNTLKANAEDTANAVKFKELMKKHGFKKDSLKVGFETMMKEFENSCREIYHSLRSEDLKEYPQYLEMKLVLKTMLDSKDYTERINLFVKMMKKITDFSEAPHMKALLKMMTMDT